MGFLNNKTKNAAAQAVNARSAEIEFLNSPSTRHVNDNAANVFSAFVFTIVFALVAVIGYLIACAMNIWVLCIGFALATIALVHLTAWQDPAPFSLSLSSSTSLSKQTCARC